jgi:hypothetical protein
MFRVGKKGTIRICQGSKLTWNLSKNSIRNNTLKRFMGIGIGSIWTMTINLENTLSNFNHR